MPYVQIEDEIYNGLDDDFKQKLKVYQPEDVSGLKDKANTILSEKKALEAELAQARAEIKAAKVVDPDQQSGAEKLQAQLEDAMGKLKASEESYQSLQTQVQRGKLEAEAMRLAAGMTKDTNRAKLLKDQFLARLAIDGDSINVLDESGKPTISTMEELSGQIKQQYPFLVDASPASGGGAKGDGGGAASSKTVTRANFEAMSHPERAKFAQSGGKVIED